ncbi:hypothetical protein [Streptomyces sp. NPDC007883]|uniref:hypothetical protein n=1 Tax=Streptomyces sp. NPDC007883 TaxID=3155116 RepID=UPI0033E81C3B
MSACRKARTAESALVFAGFIVLALFALVVPAFSLAAAATPHPWPSPHTPSHAPEMPERQLSARGDATRGGVPGLPARDSADSSGEDGIPSGWPGAPSRIPERGRVLADDTVRRGPASPLGDPVTAATAAAGTDDRAAGSASRCSGHPTARTPAVLQVFRC